LLYDNPKRIHTGEAAPQEIGERARPNNGE
jgi:hypothetical protein